MSVLTGVSCGQPTEPHDAPMPVPQVSGTESAGVDQEPRLELDRVDVGRVTPGSIHAEEAKAAAEISAGLTSIANGLGYALTPSRLPSGFRLIVARLVDLPDGAMATTFFEGASMAPGGEDMGLGLFYPVQFAPVPQAGDANGLFSPPSDAVVRVVVSGELAYLMKGEWDERTIQLLASYTAQWNYNGRLTLYFPYRPPSGETQWAMLSSNTGRHAWIGVGGLIGIAESVRAVTDRDDPAASGIPDDAVVD